MGKCSPADHTDGNRACRTCRFQRVQTEAVRGKAGPRRDRHRASRNRAEGNPGARGSQGAEEKQDHCDRPGSRRRGSRRDRIERNTGKRGRPENRQEASGHFEQEGGLPRLPDPERRLLRSLQQEAENRPGIWGGPVSQHPRRCRQSKKRPWPVRLLPFGRRRQHRSRQTPRQEGEYGRYHRRISQRGEQG